MAFTDTLGSLCCQYGCRLYQSNTMVDDAHQRGLLVGVYTVDFSADIKQCQHWQVDLFLVIIRYRLDNSAYLKITKD